jgi:hypothetical protein
MMAGEAVLPDGPAAQLTRPIRARFGFLISGNHPEIIRGAVSRAGTKKRAPEGTRLFY